MKKHLLQYLAEFLGTAIMMCIGIGAVTLMWAAESPMRALIPSDDLRRLITGFMFAGGGTLVVLSRLGQFSGGHLNPAVTLAFWSRGQVRTLDAFCYIFAQVLGAILGVLLVQFFGGTWAESVRLGITLPGAGFSLMTVFMAEVISTGLLVFAIFYCVSRERLQNKTPFIAGLLVALLVFVEAPISGTSLNPARSFAPAMLVSDFSVHWLYWTAPIIGALLAVVIFRGLWPKKHGCAKLFHTSRYPCIFEGCAFKVLPAGALICKEGEQADTAYVIERGEVEVIKATETAPRVLATLGPGDWIGEMALLLSLPRTASMIAKTEVQLRPVTKENFTHVIEEHPSETLKLLTQLAERLNETDKRAASSVATNRA